MLWGVFFKISKFFIMANARTVLTEDEWKDKLDASDDNFRRILKNMIASRIREVKNLKPGSYRFMLVDTTQTYTGFEMCKFEDHQKDVAAYVRLQEATVTDIRKHFTKGVKLEVYGT